MRKGDEYGHTEHVIDLDEVSARFEEMIREVIEDYRIWVVAKEGQPELVILPFDEYDRLRFNDSDDLDEHLNQLHESIRASLGDRQLPPSEEMIREMRDQQLMRNIGLLPQDDTEDEA